jgi:hypothetical protein
VPLDDGVAAGSRTVRAEGLMPDDDGSRAGEDTRGCAARDGVADLDGAGGRDGLIARGSAERGWAERVGGWIAERGSRVHTGARGGAAARRGSALFTADVTPVLGSGRLVEAGVLGVA